MENRPESAVSHGRSLQAKARLPEVQSLISRATACDTVRVAPAHESAVRHWLRRPPPASPPPSGFEEATEVQATPRFDEAQQTLGDFRLLRVIGRGGMGVVFEAEQVSLGRRAWR